MSSDDQRFFLEVSHDELCLVQALLAGSAGTGDRLVVFAATVIITTLFQRMGREGVNQLLEKTNTLHKEMLDQGVCSDTL